MAGLVNAMAVTAPAAVEAAEAEPQVHAGPEASDPANDWLCTWCLNRVASEKDRLYYDGKSEFTFRNPEGMRFDIIIFSRTIGCRQTGIPTIEHTWFPGHRWSYCLCDRCNMHLGWQYKGPSEFAGLIRARIIRALLIRS
jgi:hypothetical protein